MAVRAASFVLNDDATGLIRWSGLLNTDTGAPVAAGFFADKSVQVTGTFGAGGTLAIQGSNDGGTTWALLHDHAGADAVLTSGAEMILLAESPLLIRPAVTGGDGTTNLAVHVALVARGK